MKVFVVGTDTYYTRFMTDVELVDKIKEADIVLFTGGEDVSPNLYKCRKHPLTYCNPTRDEFEVEIFNQITDNQLVIGICRGSQFLTVMNGGRLVQHCEGHAVGMTHSITNGKMSYHITSTHHQMMYPFNLSSDNYDILFKSERRSSIYEGDNIDRDYFRNYGEPEIVLYHKTDFPKCLAIQGHPEMIPESPVAKMLDELIKKLINGIK